MRQSSHVTPDFLCIGAQKAGTTWLYHNLRRHPQLHMPPLKEIHFFDRGPQPYVLDYFSRHAPTRRRFLRWLHEGSAASHRQPSHLFWCLRFFCLPRSVLWYTSLFARPDGDIAGDITPGYARMPRDKVARAHWLLPHARIIYLLRDPIDRAWSQAAMYFRQYHGSRDITRVAHATIHSFLFNPYNLRNGDYATTLSLWRAFYPPQQMLIIAHDEIESGAAQSLRRIFAFLQVEDEARHVPPDINRRIYTRPYPDLPPELASALARHFYPGLDRLNGQLNTPYTHRWLDRAHTLRQT